MNKLWSLLNKGFRDFGSREVIRAHANLSIKIADKLLFVLGGVLFTPLLNEGILLGSAYFSLGVACLLGFILFRNIGYSLLAELDEPREQGA